MMSKRTFNWDQIYRDSPASGSPELFNYWKFLSNTFGNKSIDEWDFIIHALGYPRYNDVIRYINRILKTEDYKLPKGNFFSVINNSIPLPELLTKIKKLTYSHTVYTFACIRLVMNFAGYLISDWINCKISDYNEGFLLGVELPKWLITVIERQRILAYQSGLSDESPLLFVTRWNDMKKSGMNTRALRGADQEVIDFYYRFRSETGVGFDAMVDSFKSYAGMKPGAIFQRASAAIGIVRKGSKKTGSRRLILQHNLVGVYAYENGRRTMYDFGYCLYETERGIYLVNGTKGLYLVPYYLITQPVIRKDRKKDNDFKDKLSSLGYANADFYGTIVTHKQLITHKIIPHKLGEKSVQN